MLAASFVLVLASRTASADCVIFGMRPTVALPTMSSGQEFSFLASDDCATLRFSIRGTGLSWRPKSGGPTGPGPYTYRVVLTDEEWDEVKAFSGPTLTWVVTGTTIDGAVTRVSTTNEIRVTRDLATADATLLGPEERATAGTTVAGVGDVDGDGQIDVLIGAPTENEGSGVVYLSTGPVTGTIDLSETGTQFIGENRADRAGVSIAGAGDVDADGYDDVVIGAPNYGMLFSPTGAAYLVLGPVTGSFDLSLADATFVGWSQSYAGASVSSAGDVDGDGLPDLLVGAYAFYGPDDGANCCRGAAYVMSGTRRGTRNLALADARAFGATTSDNLGYSVDGVGDFDGDGLDDILIGSVADDNGYNSGTSYVFFGPLSGEFDPSEADVKLVGEAANDYAGGSTAAAGDVDADGLQDLLVGSAYNGGAGAAYLVRGGVTGALSLGDADAKLVGESEGDYAGGCVSGAGDVDADGHDDILVGASDNDEGGPTAGATYVVRGPVSGSLDLRRADLKLVGVEDDWAGIAVSSAGDLDGDGRADILVGAPGNSTNGLRSGAAYVLYGSGL
jgi:hypothetical protein